MNCLLCNKIMQTNGGLSYHLSQTHKIKYKEYYDKFFKHPMDGICKVCGKETKFRNMKYRSYCSRNCFFINPEFKTKEFFKRRLEKSKQTCLKKYGTEFNSQSPEHKRKVHKWWKNPKNSSKIKSVKQNIKNTCLEKYGVDNPAKDEKIKNKFTNTIRNKSIEEKQQIIIKRNQTCLKKYGVDNVRKSEKVIKKIKDTKLKKYGKLCLTKNLPFSKSSQKFFKLVVELNKDVLSNYQYHDLGDEFSLQTASGNRFYYDFTAHNLKKIIEFHGQAFHPTSNLIDEKIGWNIYKKELTAKEAREKEHQKFQLAKEIGYDILVVWDFEVKSDLTSSLIKASNFLRGIK